MKIILINGSKNYNQKSNWIKATSKAISKNLFGEKTQENMNSFEKFLKEHNYDVKQFKWNGKLEISKIREEAKKLHRELKKEKNILIVAKNNGGLLAQFALLGLNHKLIQIATPNVQTKTNLYVINIYSNTDKIQKAGIKYYQLLTGHISSRKMYGKNVRNISMDGLNHDEFDKKDKYKIYEDIIKKVINE